MSLALVGKTVALAEGRQLEELRILLEKEGANTFCCPLLSILDGPNTEEISEWLQHLIAGRFDSLILLTGEGLRRLMCFAQRAGLRDDVIAALGKVQLITRGPKPVLALKEIGLKPNVVATAPTTAGVISALKNHDLTGKTVGVQLYSEANPALTEYLTTAGATVVAVQPYVYAPASDADRVVELIQKTAHGSVDVLVFTSSPQVERVYEVAHERQLDNLLKQGMQRVKIASVGPLVTETIKNKGAEVHIQPEQGFQMKNLVVHIRRAFTPQVKS